MGYRLKFHGDSRDKVEVEGEDVGLLRNLQQAALKASGIARVPARATDPWQQEDGTSVSGGSAPRRQWRGPAPPPVRRLVPRQVWVPLRTNNLYGGGRRFDGRACALNAINLLVGQSVCYLLMFDICSCSSIL